MKRIGGLGGLVVFVLLTVSCSTARVPTAVEASPHGSPPPAGTSGSRPGAPAPDPAPTASSPASSGTPAGIPGSRPGGAGADPDGIGDPLFPGAGNPGLDVQHYDVDLTYDHATKAVTAEVGIDVRLTERRTELTLDAQGPQIDAVSIGGAPVTFRPDGGELRITPQAPLDAGAVVRLDVRYHFTGDAGQTELGFPIGWFNTAGGSYVLDEPDGARFWLPSNDHPSDKATFRFTIRVPPGVTGVANGALESHTTTAAGETWVWDEDQPMATYLIQVLTGDYEIVDGTGPHGLPLTSVVLRSERARWQPLIDAIGTQIADLEQYFGPYPLDRYGIAISDMPPFVAMETQGRALFSDRALVGDLATDGPVLAHELTHQWFGDAVTPERWKDVWLNESFATYGEWLWEAHGSGTSGPAAVDGPAEAALSHRPPGKTADPTLDELFGADVYEGGAVAVHALRLTIGDPAFFTLLRRWVADNDGHSRTTADFIALASDVTGRNLQPFFDEWLYSERPPTTFPPETTTSGTEAPSATTPTTATTTTSATPGTSGSPPGSPAPASPPGTPG